METVVNFENDEGVVEHRFKLPKESDYLCVDNVMHGQHKISVRNGDCRVCHRNNFDRTIKAGEDADVQLVSGRPIVIAHPAVELPNWHKLHRELFDI